jgi:hypothetical protein
MDDWAFCSTGNDLFLKEVQDSRYTNASWQRFHFGTEIGMSLEDAKGGKYGFILRREDLVKDPVKALRYILREREVLFRDFNGICNAPHPHHDEKWNYAFGDPLTHKAWSKRIKRLFEEK